MHGLKLPGVSEIDVTLGPRKTRIGSTIQQDGNSQLTLKIRPISPGPHRSNLEPNPCIDFHINVERPITALPAKPIQIRAAQRHEVLALKQSCESSGVLVPLVESRQEDGLKPLPSVVSSSIQPVVVYADPSVGVSEAELDREVELEVVWVGEVELVDGSVLHVDSHPGGAVDEP